MSKKEEPWREFFNSIIPDIPSIEKSNDDSETETDSDSETDTEDYLLSSDDDNDDNVDNNYELFMIRAMIRPEIRPRQMIQSGNRRRARLSAGRQYQPIILHSFELSDELSDEHDVIRVMNRFR